MYHIHVNEIDPKIREKKIIEYKKHLKSLLRNPILSNEQRDKIKKQMKRFN